MNRREQQRFGPFIEFLRGLVAELNGLAGEGWVLLVEGRRDEIAMKSIGYRGRIVTSADVAKGGVTGLGVASGVIILTDTDREGRQLAARYARELSHEGLKTSLLQRKRLLVASKGVFRHIENLSRFADLLAA